MDKAEIQTVEDESDTIQVYRGTIPGGSFIVARIFEIDAFGILAMPHIRALRGKMKMERRKGARAIERLIRTHGLMKKGENILAVSVGADRNGKAILVVTSEIGTTDNRY